MINLEDYQLEVTDKLMEIDHCESMMSTEIDALAEKHADVVLDGLDRNEAAREIACDIIDAELVSK